jgi:hypothetical protein
VPSTSARGAYRARAEERRQRRVTVKFTIVEHEKVSAAARRAGMAPGAYAAQAVLDAAEYRSVPVSRMQQEMVLALMQAVAQVRTIGADLNTAVARLNGSGSAGPDLEPAARYCTRVLRLLEEASVLVKRRLR